MAKDFTGNYSSDITLSNASYNPVSITGIINTPTGTALYGTVGTAWTVTNQGTILTNDTAAPGLSLASGGLVSNAAGALIEGYTGLFASAAAATVTNAGMISINGGGGDAVFLQDGGTVTNLSNGVIIGGGVGIETGGATTVFNQGAIDAPGALVGIAIHAGGYISNAASGVITGTQFGAYFTHGAGTILNAGTIGETGAAGFGNGVGFDAGYTNRLIDEPGAVFLGLVTGGNTIGAAAVSTLELASASTAGTLSGLGTQFVDFAQITIDSGATWTLAGNAVNPAGVALTTSGTLIVASSLANSGTVAGVVTLASGASIYNLAGAVMKHGKGPSIYSDSAGVTVTNDGLITNSSTKSAVALKDGGVIDNGAGATIIGSDHVAAYVTGASGVVRNGGTIMSIGVGTAGVTALAMESGGYVGNAASGLISSAYGIGIYINGAAGTVINAGRIAQLGSSGVGAVGLFAGGYVSNASTGTITSALRVGVYINGGAGTLLNNGQIQASGTHTGVVFDEGGSAANQSQGTIIGGTNHSAIYMTGGVGTVVNYGLLVGGGTANGVVFDDGGTVINRAGGIIQAATGANGIFITGAPAGTVNNYGFIADVDLASSGRVVDETGGTITSVTLPVSGPATLVMHPQATVTGSVLGGGADSTLELAPAESESGTLTGIGTQFNNFGSIVFDTGATWFIAGNTIGLSGTIDGFALGDTIEVTGVTATGSSYSAGVLTIDEAAGFATLNLPGTFTTASFDVVPVAGGTDVSLVAPCFRAGTRIRTERGCVAVESLQVGERVLAHFGDGLMAPHAVAWVGHRTLDCRRHRRPSQVWPVRVKAGAFGARQPVRDLWLSPDHAVIIDSVLVPIKFLINGAAIAQVETSEVTYCHVELQRHAVLLAEGLGCESFLDTGNRGNFANGGDSVALHPDFVPLRWDAQGCAPLLVAGRQLDALRARCAGTISSGRSRAAGLARRRMSSL